MPKRRLFLAVLLLTLVAVAQYGSDTPARDKWQRPNEVMDMLDIRAGSTVADIGAGRGYFTFRLAERVGPSGKVYSEDIADEVIRDINQRAKDRNLTQIAVIKGAENDARLPADTMDAALIVDTYHEFRDFNRMLQSVRRSLKPGAKLGIIDKEEEAGRKRTEYHDLHAINEDLVRHEVLANGFKFVQRGRGFRSERGQEWWFLIFQKPVTGAP
jgi:predicted methyltransferase